ncbi:ATP-grasp domain-containing protein [Pseudoalteromonas aurantia]|uniref:ATP-grasp domain-containing protein n=1 Tax=Pseudoalteromonas aurantia 208 TaxID=1314867 RepID=A0ABR9E9F9_9GAMM|nr:ATP-grasp domain-containing protein [Pseudoalteromonas aurantia]MBE0366408.1 hypothetical protein [Pseudoalteromonas aurantia 208]
MKLIVLLCGKNIFRSDLAKLKEDKEHCYWLVVSELCFPRIKEKNLKSFSHVEVMEDFSLTSISCFLNTKNVRDNFSDIAVITNDESSEAMALELYRAFSKTAPHYDEKNIAAFSDKVAAKECLSKHGIRVPKYQVFDKAKFREQGGLYCLGVARHLEFPMIAKPVDGMGSIDVQKIHSIEELQDWAVWSSGIRDRNTYEIDEFIEGELYTCDALVENGRIIWSSVCSNISPIIDVSAGKAHGLVCMPKEDELSQALGEFHASVINAMQPPSGAVHTECFVTLSKEIVFLESHIRPPGGEAAHLYLNSYGFNIEEAHIKLRSAQSSNDVSTSLHAYSAWIDLPRKQGTVIMDESVCPSSCYKFEMTVKLGEWIEQTAKDLQQQAAVTFMLTHSDFEELTKDINYIRTLQLVSS